MPLQDSKMKITKRQLRKIIKEEIEVMHLSNIHDLSSAGRDFGEGGSAEMAKGQLFHIAKNAQSLHDKLNNDDQLPEWVQSKIAVVADYVETIADYLEYKIHQSENGEQ